MCPAAVVNPPYPVTIAETSELLTSTTGQSALNGPLVSAPSLPNPVVEGDIR